MDIKAIIEYANALPELKKLENTENAWYTRSKFFVISVREDRGDIVMYMWSVHECREVATIRSYFCAFLAQLSSL